MNPFCYVTILVNGKINLYYNVDVLLPNYYINLSNLEEIKGSVD